MKFYFKAINFILKILLIFFFQKKNIKSFNNYLLENAAYGIEYKISFGGVQEIGIFYEEKFFQQFLGIKSGFFYVNNEYSFYNTKDGFEKLKFSFDSYDYFSIPVILNINLFSGDFSLYSGLDFGFLISSKLLHSLSLDQDKIDKLKDFLSHCSCRCSGKTSTDKNARDFYRSLANKDKKSKIEDQDIYSLFGIKYIVGMKIPLFLGFYFGIEFKDFLKPFISHFSFKSSRESSTLYVILGLNINRFIEIF